jgi:electron transport complex protein RnfC
MTDPGLLESFTFKNGVHPEEYKEYACSAAIERMPFTSEYTVFLSQHIGAPAKPVVTAGQNVCRGQLIAEPGGFVSVSHHSPVSGTVSAIEPRIHPSGQLMEAICITCDPLSTQKPVHNPVSDWKEKPAAELAQIIQNSGIVGLGGAAFPTHVKLMLPPGKTCTTILVNGCECEPFLTSDHRSMLEFAPRFFEGLEILKHMLSPETIYVGVESNKPDAIECLSSYSTDLPVKVCPLQTKYPQGAEKMLISAVTGKEVPSGKLPLELGCVVINVGTVIAIADAILRGKHLYERVVTVTGPAVKRPSNLIVPIGTSVAEVLEFCGGISDNTTRIILGGPMMGFAQSTVHVPVMKGTSGITVLDDSIHFDDTVYNCIRCGRCLDACPMFLNPSRLGQLSRKHLYEEMEQCNLMDCMECASCSFACPSNIPLVQNFRIAKATLREKKERK